MIRPKCFVWYVCGHFLFQKFAYITHQTKYAVKCEMRRQNKFASSTGPACAMPQDSPSSGGDGKSQAHNSHELSQLSGWNCLSGKMFCVANQTGLKVKQLCSMGSSANLEMSSLLTRFSSRMCKLRSRSSFSISMATSWSSFFSADCLSFKMSSCS